MSQIFRQVRGIVAQSGEQLLVARVCLGHCYTRNVPTNDVFLRRIGSLRAVSNSDMFRELLCMSSYKLVVIYVCLCVPTIGLGAPRSRVFADRLPEEGQLQWQAPRLVTQRDVFLCLSCGAFFNLVDTPHILSYCAAENISGMTRTGALLRYLSICLLTSVLCSIVLNRK